jgi:hypothetical protein
MSKQKASDARMSLNSRISRGKALTVRGSVAHTSMAGSRGSHPAADIGVPGGVCCAGTATRVGGKAGRATARRPIDLGNTKCPVSGGAVDGKSFGERNGLRFGFCSPGCAASFAAGRGKPSAAPPRPWTVVREPADRGTAGQDAAP